MGTGRGRREYTGYRELDPLPKTDKAPGQSRSLHRHSPASLSGPSRLTSAAVRSSLTGRLRADHLWTNAPDSSATTSPADWIRSTAPTPWPAYSAIAAMSPVVSAL